ncbi:hypothetical protein M446_1216 [Methylobacterium sp. 4-46]|uniref:hypothetical protein n=1 Tax=unclassified Methylobacterium TaxID=2615210 RepID=UPI000152C650|nr:MULTISPECIES: hypothetical protein [Methylobacterium]ACA15741.1 hypothetical protein M446_1216 [Methylobacterium sp. 4-46]WFT81474.1 hypothetical protein QA634_06185 [Methylobacterium nodulans]
MSGLNDRIAAAVSGTALSSGEVANLIVEAGRATVALKAEHVQAERRALDPRLSGDDVEQARADMDRLAFAGRCLATGIEALKPVLDRAQRRKDEERRREDYAAAREKRDAAATLLRERYPALAGDIAGLLREVTEAEHAVEAVNRRLPQGAVALVLPEFEVRGVSPSGTHAAGVVWLLAQRVVLPALEGRDAAMGLNIWDRSRG